MTDDTIVELGRIYAGRHAVEFQIGTTPISDPGALSRIKALRGLLDGAIQLEPEKAPNAPKKPRRWVTLAIWAVLTIFFLVLYVAWRGAA